jgi:hypothetical protein
MSAPACGKGAHHLAAEATAAPGDESDALFPKAGVSGDFWRQQAAALRGALLGRARCPVE